MEPTQDGTKVLSLSGRTQSQVSLSPLSLSLARARARALSLSQRLHAITVDHEDNLWLTDDSANTITKCDRSGKRYSHSVGLSLFFFSLARSLYRSLPATSLSVPPTSPHTHPLSV